MKNPLATLAAVVLLSIASCTLDKGPTGVTLLPTAEDPGQPDTAAPSPAGDEPAGDDGDGDGNPDGGGAVAQGAQDDAPDAGGARDGSCGVETCDGTDEDCDGEIDEELVLGSCVPDDADGSEGACQTFRLVCEDGAPICTQSHESPIELCNGEDDDCDGEVDEDPDTSCYIGLTTFGCEQRADGSWACRGLCEPGARTCDGGRPVGLCMGQVSPDIAGEQCGGSPAVDDDCDGSVDEGCPCDAGDSQACYTGPASTRDVGACRDGVQTCTRSFFGNYTWGGCNGETLPGQESCENVGEDDDCDGDVNDIDTEGDVCLSGERGRCALGTLACDGMISECVPNEDPTTELCNALDDDCDGRTDENFDLAHDENMCGSCTNSCRSSDTCCDGACANLDTDSWNCGRCGARCADGEVCAAGRCRCASGLTECNESCVDTDDDENHCGSCNNACTNNEICIQGSCDCGGDNSYCNGSCRTAGYYTNNNDHCGSCNAGCTGGRVCLGTSCQCPGGDAYCDGACRDASYFVDNDADCGSCSNTCGGGTQCQGVTCVATGD